MLAQTKRVHAQKGRKRKMLNFAVGPVQGDPEILNIGAEQVPYFRTAEFSALMKENERMMCRLAGAGEGARAAFLTAAGTAGMEAIVVNLLSESDKVLVVDGGSFGHRFAELCELYGVSHTVIHLNPFEPLSRKHLEPYENGGYTAFLVNLHETSTCVLYDMDLIHGFCKRNDLMLYVDSISSFLADPFDMEKTGSDVMLVSSQKALALPPGLAVLVLSKRAVERVYREKPRCMYLSLRAALENGERGQTPFTPAVSLLRQLNRRLQKLEEKGIAAETEHIRSLALDFRSRVADLPFDLPSPAMSNAATALCPRNTSAKKIFEILKDEYQIWVCPNGGELAEKVFRVGHMGYLTKEDNTSLIEALKDMERRGLL